MTGAYRDTLRFYFTVTDVEGDTVVGYRKYSGSFVWKSNLDLDGQDIDSLMFRVVPKDMVVGVANWGSGTVSILRLIQAF